MKAAEMRQLKPSDLHAEVARLERHLFDLRAQAVTEKLADPTQLGKTRRDIARLLTVIREKELAARPMAAPPATSAASAPASAPGRRKSNRAKKAE
jgi:large subunit ribosomal protein L29